jgi:hypothetical protein
MTQITQISEWDDIWVNLRDLRENELKPLRTRTFARESTSGLAASSIENRVSSIMPG